MRKIVVFLAIMAIILPNITEEKRFDVPLRRGDYTTAWNQSQEWLEWMAKFNIVHAGSIEEPLSPYSINYLRQHGVKTIMADDWLPADYYYLYENNTPFMQWVYDNRYNVTLNPDGPFPHCEEENYTWMHEYYFDFAVPQLVEHRVEYIVDGLRKNGYDAIFFDWGNGLFLNEKGYESINATYHSRHSKPYSQAAADFLAALREEMPEITIENNQGFREAWYYFPVLDYDMTESYITGCDYYGRKLYIKGIGLTEVPDTVYYPVSINEFNGSLKDTMEYVDYLEQLKEEYGGEHFKSIIFMNYAAPEFVYTGQEENGYRVYEPRVPRNAIYFGYAVAKLVGEISYTETPWNHEYEKCNVYFYDIGKPLGEKYEKIDGGFVRYYTNGIAVAGEWQDEKKLHLASPYIPSNASVYDAFEDKWLKTGENEITVDIKPSYDALTGRMAPAGRIYVYASNSIYVRIERPKNMIYVMDRGIMPAAKTIVIGKITVEATSNANGVSFYVDKMLKFNDTMPPYQWLWDEPAIGWHEITAKAGNEEDSVKLWVFIP